MLPTKVFFLVAIILFNVFSKSIKTLCKSLFLAYSIPFFVSYLGIKKWFVHILMAHSKKETMEFFNGRVCSCLGFRFLLFELLYCSLMLGSNQFLTFFVFFKKFFRLGRMESLTLGFLLCNCMCGTGIQLFFLYISMSLLLVEKKVNLTSLAIQLTQFR